MPELQLLPPQKRNLRIFDVLVILILAMFVIPLIYVWAVQLNYQVKGITLELEQLQNVTLLPAVFLQEIGLLWLTIASVRRGYGQPISSIGLKRLPVGRMVGSGLLWGTGLFWAQVMAEQVSYLFFSFFMGKEQLELTLAEETAQVVSLFSLGQSPVGLALLILLLVLVVPFAEEVFFRGFTYQVFKERYGAQGAVFASALLFAVMHGYTVEFLPIFVVGVGLGYIVKHFGSIWPGVIGHACVNLAAILTGFLLQ